MRERRSATHEANPHWVLLLFGGAAVIACLIMAAVEPDASQPWLTWRVMLMAPLALIDEPLDLGRPAPSSSRRRHGRRGSSDSAGEAHCVVLAVF